MKKYHPDKLKQWIDGGKREQLQLDFETYLQWVIDIPNQDLDEHFAPTVELAQPCRVKYHFYGNFKLYSSDMKAIIARLGTPENWYVNNSHRHVTAGKMIHFYSKVRREVMEQLIQDFSDDLEFYYTLYPEEQGSEKKLFL